MVHRIGECMTGILIQVTIHDSIRDSIILEIIPSSFHELSEFSFCDYPCIFGVISFITIICHNLCGVLFDPNILNIHILFFCHLPHKMVAYINIFLVRIPTCLLFSKKIAHWLSSWNISGFWNSDTSSSNTFKNFNFWAHDNIAKYSSSIMVRVIFLWVFYEHVSSVPSSVATRPLTIFLVSLYVA